MCSSLLVDDFSRPNGMGSQVTGVTSSWGSTGEMSCSGRPRIRPYLQRRAEHRHDRRSPLSAVSDTQMCIHSSSIEQLALRYGAILLHDSCKNRKAHE